MKKGEWCNSFIIHEQETLATAEGFLRGQLLRPVGKPDGSQSGRESEHTKGAFLSIYMCGLFLPPGVLLIRLVWRNSDIFD